jgi:hypothetical protein
MTGFAIGGDDDKIALRFGCFRSFCHCSSSSTGFKILALLKARVNSEAGRAGGNASPVARIAQRIGRAAVALRVAVS